MITVSSGRSRDQTKKGRTTASPKKEMATRVCQPNDDEPRKPITKASASVLRLGRKDQEEDETQETKMDTEYSMSPPPSSLPLPSFALTRLRLQQTAAAVAVAAVQRTVAPPTSSGASSAFKKIKPRHLRHVYFLRYLGVNNPR
ncbi:hypothetical protein BHE74_00012312 [Ensete ventricosum]|nr:hypothetical protein BHE74_00012312 [Ensete ventricosum]